VACFIGGAERREAVFEPPEARTGRGGRTLGLEAWLSSEAALRALHNTGGEGARCSAILLKRSHQHGAGEGSRCISR